MAYQGGDGGYGQNPTYDFPDYNSFNQQNQVPYEMNIASRSTAALPSYNGNQLSNPSYSHNHSVYQANSFAPAINFSSTTPTYPNPQYSLAQQTWPNTARVRTTHSDPAFSQPPQKRQRIEPSPSYYPVLEQAPNPAQALHLQNQIHPAQMTHMQTPQTSYSPIQMRAPSSSNVTPQTNQKHAQTKPSMPDAQYKIFLPLAEEFFDAAYTLGPTVAKKSNPEAIETYQKLISTGLSCLEGAIKDGMPPRLEAKIRIRYASVLYSDTSNHMDGELALSKGIALCERNHLIDLKYHMQYLLTKFMYKASPKAAFKSLDLHIEDAQVCKHYSWVYAFRFLRASLSLESGNLSDAPMAMQNLYAIAELAHLRDHRAILLTSALFQARAHFRSGKSDTIERIQRSIAVAFSYQQDGANQIPQLLILTHILDLSCSILKGMPSEISEKMKSLKSKWNLWASDPSWSEVDEHVSIPIQSTQGHPHVVTSDTRGVLDISKDGIEQLVLSGFDQRTMGSMSFLLCGISCIYNDGRDKSTETYFHEVLRQVAGDLPSNLRAVWSASESQSRLEWRNTIVCYCYLYLAFYYATRTEWVKLQNILKKMRSTIRVKGISTEGSPDLLMNYITGIYLQGTGDLEGALKVFESDDFFKLHLKSIVSSTDQLRHDLSLLAALNALWIHQEPSRLDPSRNSEKLEELEPLCSANRIENFSIALKLIKATIKTDPPTANIKVKNYLIETMSAARKSSTTQFLSITLNVMSQRFFTNIIGSQAEKSSRAAASQAYRAGNKLWMSVADGVLASCLEIQQKVPEAKVKRESAINLAREALGKE